MDPNRGLLLHSAPVDHPYRDYYPRSDGALQQHQHQQQQQQQQQLLQQQQQQQQQALASSGSLSGRSARPSPAIPPSSVPSLSSGQGFYTVESLLGATVVPPNPVAPPPPRILVSEPYGGHHPLQERVMERFDRPPRPRVLPDEGGRAFAPPLHHQNLDRVPHGAHPLMVRKMLPHPDLPPRDLGHVVRGGPGPRNSYIQDPRFRPGREHLPPPMHPGPVYERHRERGREREREQGRGWGPARDLNRNWVDRRMDLDRDRQRPIQRPRVRKQIQRAKPAPRSKSPPPDAAVVEKSPAGKQKSIEGGPGGPGWCSVCEINCFRAETLKKHLDGKRHKKQLEKLNGEPGGTKKSEGEDEVMKEAEKTDDLDEAVKKTTNEEDTQAAKEGEESEQVADDGTLKDPATVVGNKRAKRDRDGFRASKKRRKSLASSDVPNATVAEEKEDAKADNESLKKAEKGTDALEICQLCNVTCTSKAILEAHLKGKKHALRLKKSVKSPGVDDGKVPASAGGENKSSETVKDGQGELGKEGDSIVKEGGEGQTNDNVTKELANGSVGQPVEGQ